MSEDKNQERPQPPDRVAEEMSEAEIDRNLQDTFPASDPPSWTLGIDHHKVSRTPTTGPSAQGESK